MQVQKPQNPHKNNWPDKGYVLTRNNDTTLWPYLEASFTRDGYEALSPEQIKEACDIDCGDELLSHQPITRKCTSVGSQPMPLMGFMSCGHADITAITSHSAFMRM